MSAGKTKNNNIHDLQSIHKISKKSWISYEELRQQMKVPQKMYIIFAAPQCDACILLRKALRMVQLNKKVTYINVKEDWANAVAQKQNVRGIPELIVTDENRNIVRKVIGPGDILLFLVLYSDLNY